MGNVWVIERGEYSDYHVVGVFTSEANAQVVLDKLGEGEIAKWVLDPAVEELRAGLEQWNVWILANGDIERVNKAKNVYSHELAGNVHIWLRSQAEFYNGKNAPDVLDCTVWARDEAHAIKIANEHRTRMLAVGDWRP